MTHRFLLHGVAEPSGKITLCVCPGHSVRHRNFTDSFSGLNSARNSKEVTVIAVRPFGN